MNTVSIAERSAPTVPLLGAQGWIVAPADVEPPGTGVVALLRQWLCRNRIATRSPNSTSICCATSA